MKPCERCGRIRSEKHMKQAVYVHTSSNGEVIVDSVSESYRCQALASCTKAKKYKQFIGSNTIRNE